MPRTKEFDVEATLDRAVELFRRRGYSATSIQDLVDTLGINRASLYATFGTKEALFAQAVQRYLEVTATMRTAWVEQSSPRQTLVAYVQQTAELVLGQGSDAGCMIVNACTELGEFTPETTRQVQGGLKSTYRFLLSYAQAAAAQGELPPGHTPEAVAAQALACGVSLPVMARAGLPRQTILAVAQSFEKSLGL